MSDGDLFDDMPERSAAAATPQTLPEERPGGAPAEGTAVGYGVTEEPVAADDAPEVAEPSAPSTPSPADEPPPPPPPRRTTPLPRAGTLGETLAKLRLGRGLDIDTVADETKIKPGYLRALEEDAFSELPHMVYALAYVKKLCALYGVGDADADGLLTVLREQLAYEIPEDIDKSVICREQDEETRRKLHQISVALVTVAALAALLLVAGVATLLLRVHGSRTGGTEQNGIEEQLSEDWLARHRKTQKLRSSKIKLRPYREQRGGARRR